MCSTGAAKTADGRPLLPIHFAVQPGGVPTPGSGAGPGRVMSKSGPARQTANPDRPRTLRQWQQAPFSAFFGDGGTSFAGFRSKNPLGFSMNPMYAVGITG
jgi:hypothetical protein